MASIPPYDSNNIFMKIMRGESPCHKVYEDEHTFAFMDINPRSEGHALVVPKTGSRNILDANAEDLAHIVRTAQKIAKAAVKALQADGISIAQSSEPAADQDVFHTHFHVLPRYEGVDLRPPGQRGDDAKIAENARLLREALAG